MYDNPGGQSSQNSHHNASSQGQNHHCCNFHHIVQLQDGSTRSVLCSNLKMAPPHPTLRLRNQLINAKPCPQGTPQGTLTSASGDPMGNGCGAVLQNSGHNSSSATASTTESVLNKMYSGPERII